MGRPPATNTDRGDSRGWKRRRRVVVDKIPVLPRLTRRRIRKIVGDPLTKTNSTVRRDSIRSVVWQQLQQQPHRHSTAYGRTAIDVANPNAAVSNPNTAVANPNATGY